jgi:hypothetical protein
MESLPTDALEWAVRFEALARDDGGTKQKPLVMNSSQGVSTDCRTEEGVTVGLIDSIITAARVLAGRDLQSPAILEALKDLRSDEDVARLIRG